MGLPPTGGGIGDNTTRKESYSDASRLYCPFPAPCPKETGPFPTPIAEVGASFRGPEGWVFVVGVLSSE